MATLYIQEYAKLASDDMGKTIQVGLEPALASQTVAIGGASAQSVAFNQRTEFVRVHTDVVCSVKFEANPTATTSDARMPAGATEFFGVRVGDKVAVISNT